MSNENDDLAKKYIEYMDLPEGERGTTFDDFFDWVDVPVEQRTDFAVAAILNRAQKLLDKTHQHRTYYQLENYHWKRINDEGKTKGVKVWFPDLDGFDEDYVKEGTIIEHDIHLEGEVMVRVEWEYTRNFHIADHIWVTDEKDRSGETTHTSNKLIFMDWTFFNKVEAIECARRILNRKIGNHEEKIKYLKKKLDAVERIDK
jgi:hypothetical protein